MIEHEMDDDTPDTPDTPEVAPEILSEAMEQGWVPKDQWTGRAEEWSDAETFVRRGREINPILRKALKKERERTAALEAELRSTGATVAELREYLAKVEERATKNALAQLKRQRTEALESGDHAAAASYEEQMDELKEAKSAVPAAKPAAQPNLANHPEVIEWMAHNPWYSPENEDLIVYANGVAQSIAQKMQQAGQPFTPATVLAKVTERVRKAFPSQFGGTEPPAAMFEGGGSSSGSTRTATGGTRKAGGGFSTLPKSAQAQFQRFYDAGYYVNTKTGKPLDLAAAQAEYYKEYE